MGRLRASLAGAPLLLALTAGCGASGADSAAGGGFPGGGGGPGGGSGGGGGGPGDPGDAEWQEPESIDIRPEDASAARVVVGPTSGDAVAGWLQFDGSDVRLWASRLATTESAWSGDERVKDNAPGEDATAPRVAVDAAGDAVAVWLEEATNIISVWGNDRE